jgi:hypothetical protein
VALVFEDVRVAVQEALSLSPADELARVKALVASWGYTKGWAPVVEPEGFERYQGAALATKIEPGRPPKGARVGQVFGFDARGRTVLVQGLRGGRIFSETALRHAPSRVVQIRVEDGDPRITSATVLDLDGEGRAWRKSAAGRHMAGLHQIEYRYDDDGRLIEEIERREGGFDSGEHEHRRTMVYAADGQPEMLLAGRTVLWRRPGGSAELQAAWRQAEDALVQALAEALTHSVAGAGRVVVWLRHQDDGSWVDQAIPTASVTPLRATDGSWPASWAFEDWEIPELGIDLTRSVAALDALDEVATPRGDESRRLLMNVAARLRRSGTPDDSAVVAVSGFDSDLLVDLDAGADTQTLRAAGWLP